jgi:long-chain acyl-CoA synthetase
METAAGPEPCAVLAFRGAGEQAAEAIEHANQKLAEFQRLRRWVLWPEPDLPRTSTGKVRRAAVAAWLKGIQAAAATPTTGAASANGASAFGASTDWLLKLIADISGEAPAGVGDELRLTEDLHLDSLNRVQLAAALEERLGIAPEGGLLERAHTLGDLRAMAAGEAEGARAADSSAQAAKTKTRRERGTQAELPPAAAEQTEAGVESAPGNYIYPHWPWLRLVQWIRTAFLEAVAQPLVWLLAHPKVVTPETITAEEPLLIVANHVTAFDGPLVQYALPGPIRRRIAAAMAGDMLEDYRHFRNPERDPRQRGFYLPGPLIYVLLTALFNVFPLPRQRNFQRSFAHAGEAMDHGYNVLVFPEGTRSAAGDLARFRGGIGLLAKQSGAMVLPVAIRGLGELKAGSQRWFRSGKIEVHVGEPIRFAPEETEVSITARLHAEVERLLNTGIRD